jgi:hypothetical protein
MSGKQEGVEAKVPSARHFVLKAVFEPSFEVAFCCKNSAVNF